MTFSRSVLTKDVSTADLPEILAFVEDACQQANVDPDCIFDLQLATEEACTNIIEHAYKGRGGALRILFETRNGDVLITLHDHGRTFDPAAITPPNKTLPLERRPVGGLGLHLMYQLMDDVQFSFRPEGNTLLMVKRNAIAQAPAMLEGDERDG